MRKGAKYCGNCFVLAALAATTGALAQPAPPDPAAGAEASAVVAHHLQALADGDSDAFIETLADHVSMYNCGGANPSKWEPHLYVAGDDVAGWANYFVNEAGPHESKTEFVSSSANGAMALVVTYGEGSNKFRQWSKEHTVWVLAKTQGDWRINAFCLNANDEESGGG